MNLLTLIGIASLCFVVVFTYTAYLNNTGKGQTPREAIKEAWTNILIGFSVNYLANLVFLPMVGAAITASNNFWLGVIYTAISMLRQYVIRRYNNDKVLFASKFKNLFTLEKQTCKKL